MTEWKNLDTEQPEIGEHVLIYLKFPLYSENFKEVVYCSTSDMPLSFHSIDFMYSWPLIKTWMPIYKPQKKHYCRNEFYECRSRNGKFIISYFALEELARYMYTVNFCPICGEKADD